MNPVATLNEKLLNQSFNDGQNDTLLKDYSFLAEKYSKLENAIAVLSDLRFNKSYVFYGGVAEKLGIAPKGSSKEIDSIWEDDIFGRIHPEDLLDKHQLELQFFHLLKNLPSDLRSDYQVSSNLRMCDASGKYHMVHHRMFYVCDNPSGQIRLALCLYHFTTGESASDSLYGIIVNSSTGSETKADNQMCSSILSKREMEILRLIEHGMMSKEIAEYLSISKKTVDRHRQNILEKLHVKNSFEACRVAKHMNLF